MLLDAIATVILTGLMFIPLVNFVVGGVVGAGLMGPAGAATGVLLALSVTWLEIWVADRLGWRDLQAAPATEPVGIAQDVSPITERTIKTQPPKPRRQSRTTYEAKRGNRVAHAGKLRSAMN